MITGRKTVSGTLCLLPLVYFNKLPCSALHPLSGELFHTISLAYIQFCPTTLEYPSVIHTNNVMYVLLKVTQKRSRIPLNKSKYQVGFQHQEEENKGQRLLWSVKISLLTTSTKEILPSNTPNFVKPTS